MADTQRRDCSHASLLVSGALVHLHMAHRALRRLLQGIAPLFWGVVQHALNLQGEIEQRMQVSRHVGQVECGLWRVHAMHPRLGPTLGWLLTDRRWRVSQGGGPLLRVHAMPPARCQRHSGLQKSSREEQTRRDSVSRCARAHTQHAALSCLLSCLRNMLSMLLPACPVAVVRWHAGGTRDPAPEAPSLHGLHEHV